MSSTEDDTYRVQVAGESRKSGNHLEGFVGPTPAEVAAVLPFESIRSADIAPLFRQHFRIVGLRKLGGTLQQLFDNGIVHNFTLGDAEAQTCLRR